MQVVFEDINHVQYTLKLVRDPKHGWVFELAPFTSENPTIRFGPLEFMQAASAIDASYLDTITPRDD